MNQTTITIVGNLTDDPELRFTPNGTAVASFSVAVNPRRYDATAGAWKDGEPAFHRVAAWRHLAEHIVESLHKGDRVIVAGTLAQRHWEDEKTGEKRSAWQLTADVVGPDLTYAIALVTKAQRTVRGDVAPDDPWASASPVRPPGAAAGGGGFPDDEPPF